MDTTKKIIPDEMIPYFGSQIVVGKDGKNYILQNDVMYTGYQHSRAEFSEFFLALKEGKIVGRRCDGCNTLEIPPFELRCPKCNFKEMVLEEVSDRGFMRATPVVVFFAPANFKDEVPYATGYVMLYGKNGAGTRKKTSTAMQVRIRTTTGLIKPGILKRYDEIKIVFADKPNGHMRDIFAVPASELSVNQRCKSPLFESELTWNTDTSLQKEFSEEFVPHKKEIEEDFADLASRIFMSRRAQKDLANWKSKIKVITGGGIFSLEILENKLFVMRADVHNDPDVIFAVNDPFEFKPYLTKGYALTNLFAEGKLDLSKLDETVFRFDRIPRSLERDNC